MQNLKLHEISEDRVYCGPGALIAITGKRLPEVRSAINRAIGRRENIGITRLNVKFLEGALHNLGINHQRTDLTERTTLSKLTNTVLESDVRYIVFITDHFVTVLNGQLVDNQYRFGISVEDCRHKNKIVKSYLKIEE